MLLGSQKLLVRFQEANASTHMWRNLLEVDVFVLGNVQAVWCEVVLHSWVGLDNVSSLATHLHVVNHGLAQLVGARADGKRVGATSSKHTDTNQRNQDDVLSFKQASGTLPNRGTGQYL